MIQKITDVDRPGKMLPLLSCAMRESYGSRVEELVRHRDRRRFLQVGLPDTLAGTIVWLMSDAAAEISGGVLRVYGRS